MRKKNNEEIIQDIPKIQKRGHEKKKRQPTAPAGSDFKPEYCQMLLRHCSRGYSFQSFAAGINVQTATLEEWAQEYPEFEAAMRIAELKQKMYWENLAVKACRKRFSVSIFRYFIGKQADTNPAETKAVVLLPMEEDDSNKT